MYDKAKCRVKWGNTIEKIFRDIHGVLQRGIISPILFKIFHEDMCLYLDTENCMMVHSVPPYGRGSQHNPQPPTPTPTTVLPGLCRRGRGRPPLM